MKRIVCVTGAASGIGYASACRFAKQGAHVIACDRSEEGLNKLRREIGDDSLVETVVFDLRDLGSFSKVEEAVKKYGHLDVLVNSAGITSLTPYDKITEEEWDRIFDINSKGTFFFTRVMIPYLAKGTDPNIVNLCSVAGFRGGKFSNYAYAASKGAIQILTKCFAQTLAPQKIRVNQVAPDVVLTNMTLDLATPELIAGARKAVPLGELLEASDIAAAIEYLSGPGARYITGQTIHVNGGNFIP